MTPYGDKDLVNIGSGNGLVPDGTKSLPEPMLTNNLSPDSNFTENTYDIYRWNEFEIY